MLEEILDKIQKGEDVRNSLSTLRQQIKDQEIREQLLCSGVDISVFTALLEEEDPKVRKNAALLLGDMGAAQGSQAIYRAYCREEKLFVRAFYLEALQKIGVCAYLDELRERYEVLCEEVPEAEEKKHVQAEIRALEQIFQKEGKQVRHTFCGWEEKVSILLTNDAVGRSVTADKVKQGVNTSLGIKVTTDQLREMVQVRTFRELLFPIPIKENIPYGEMPGVLGSAVAKSKVLELLKRCHKEPAPFYFRIEARGGMPLEQRSKYAKKVSAAIEEDSSRQLLNSTGEYEFELRFLPDKQGRTHVFLKMNTIPMDRFAYRKNTIAASIHPSLAAVLMELSRPYLKEDAQILDPCCGVGTLLVERSKLLPAKEMYGTDIFGEAVVGARENAQLAGIHMNFINRDYFSFEHEYLFDEIIANLPVRGKKTKEEMDEFYRCFFVKSKEMLSPGGIMVLYSNENGFIKKQLRLMPEYKLLQEFEISKKNHFSLYIIG